MQLLLAVISCLSAVVQANVKDCVAEKFYMLTPEHTACLASKSSNALDSGITEEDRRLIVNLHNWVRREQTTAADLQLMVWDREIEEIAQRWADNCDFSHDKHRGIPGRFSLGQNLAYGQKNWEEAIYAWYDEIDDFTYGSESANVFSQVGHFTQMVWANSSKIGCGRTRCSNLNGNFYVCNYGPAGNFQWWKPYKISSTVCADCPSKCKDGLCDCGGKACENGGILDLNTCECRCTKSWHVPDVCAVNCLEVQEPNSCKTGGFYDGKCLIWSNVPDECPNTCNVCPYSGIGYMVASKAQFTSSSIAALLSAVLVGHFSY